jgi:outer membrane biosynthesis protein TonB
MKAGYTISAVAHALILGWGLLTFSAKPLEAPHVDPIVVEIITDTEVSQITNGSKTAKQTPKPTPVVDKLGEVKEPPKEPTLKVAAKQEVLTETAPPPAPPQPDPKPDPKPVEAKPPAPQPAPMPPAATEPPAPAPDPVAEALKLEEAKRKEEQKKLEDAKQKKLEEAKKREEKREEARKRQEANKKQREEVKNDLNRIETALIDKRTPQRQAVTGTIVNPTPSLGTTTGTAAQLAQNEDARLMAMLNAQLKPCWNPPVGLADAKNLVVRVSFSLKRDGTLAGEPVVTTRGSGPLFEAAKESALRAVWTCQPLRLPAAKYEAWQNNDIGFDPREMFGD